MAQWISKGGEFVPANEKVGLINNTDEIKIVDGKEVKPGEPYIYEGKDRAALFELYKEKVDKFGIKFRYDPELIVRVKQLGFKDVDEYAQIMGYDEKKEVEELKKKEEVVSKHELPPKKEAIKKIGGGKNYAGKDNYLGGFGEEKLNIDK